MAGGYPISECGHAACCGRVQVFLQPRFCRLPSTGSAQVPAQYSHAQSHSAFFGLSLNPLMFSRLYWDLISSCRAVRDQIPVPEANKIMGYQRRLSLFECVFLSVGFMSFKRKSNPGFLIQKCRYQCFSRRAICDRRSRSAFVTVGRKRFR